MTRTAAAIVLAVVIVAGGLVLLAGHRLLRGRGRYRLPARIRVEETIADLVEMAASGGATVDAPSRPVTVGGITPHPGETGVGGHRRAILAPPDATLRFRVRVPPAAALVFGAGTGIGAHGATPARFRVAVDGNEVFARTVDPSRRPERRWLDQRIPLPVAAEREVEIALGVTGGHAGVAGWSPVRVVREQRIDRQRADASRPSVLVLVVDTLRADRLGCYGATPSPSPTLDALARDGHVFVDTVAQAAWTMPSVASIMTGLPPRSHGVLGGPEPGAPSDDRDWAFLPSVLPTLATTVAAAGITTVGVSANPLVSRGTNLAHGFERFVSLERDRRTHLWATAEQVNGTFLDWLRANPGQRFLAYLHFMEPHDPYTPPADLRPPTAPGVRPRIAAGDIAPFADAIDWHGSPPLPDVEVRHLRALYDAEIRAWDRALGDLLRQLDALGRRDSTLVVVTADHGEEFQEHGKLKHGAQLYEESVHVPLVVAGPGIVAGRTTTQAQGIDLLPTITTLLGVTPPAGLPGRNVLAAGGDSPPAFLETRAGPGDGGPSIDRIAVRVPGWKLVRDQATGRSLLFDLAHDPAERDDRFATAPEGKELSDRLAAWLATTPPAPHPEARDPALGEKLHALGYVE